MDAATHFRRLDRPRALTTDEERIARHLASALGPEVLAQLAAGTVTGRCRCGCSSVSLATHGTALEPALAHLSVSATGRQLDGGYAAVTLHLVNGRIGELELFDPDRGEGHAMDPSSVSSIGVPEPDQGAGPR